jgi:hypothetical protein
MTLTWLTGVPLNEYGFTQAIRSDNGVPTSPTAFPLFDLRGLRRTRPGHVALGHLDQRVLTHSVLGWSQTTRQSLSIPVPGKFTQGFEGEGLTDRAHGLRRRIFLMLFYRAVVHVACSHKRFAFTHDVPGRNSAQLVKCV